MALKPKERCGDQDKTARRIAQKEEPQGDLRKSKGDQLSPTPIALLSPKHRVSNVLSFLKGPWACLQTAKLLLLQPDLP